MQKGARTCLIAAICSAIAACLVGTALVRADDKPPEPNPQRLLSLSSDTLTGDWDGLRPTLDEKGVKASMFLNSQYQAALRGGADTNGSGKNAATVDFIVGFDLKKLAGWDEFDALIHLQSNWGAGINPRVGTLVQVNDDADGSIGGHIGQLWIRKHWSDRRVAFQVGYLDYQTIVDRNAYANSEDRQFWYFALDNNPLVPLRVGMGAALTVKPTAWYTLILGVADGQAVPYKGGISKAFHEEAWYTGYIENGISPSFSTSTGPLPGNYRVGVFYDPGPRTVYSDERRTPETDSGDFGAYVSADQLVYHEPSPGDQGLGVFVRYGYRNPETNRVSQFWSAGAQYKGLLPERNEDVLAFGFAKLDGSRRYQEVVNPEFEHETAFELYYAIQVTKWVVVTPDVQYVINPGGTRVLDDLVTAGVRVRVSF